MDNMSTKTSNGAYPRRGLESSREVAREKHRGEMELTDKAGLLLRVNIGIRVFYASRGLTVPSAQWGATPQPPSVAASITNGPPPLVNRWAKRGPMPAVEPRYVQTREDAERLTILSDAKQIIAEAERRGLVTRPMESTQPEDQPQ